MRSLRPEPRRTSARTDPPQLLDVAQPERLFGSDRPPAAGGEINLDPASEKEEVSDIVPSAPVQEIATAASFQKVGACSTENAVVPLFDSQTGEQGQSKLVLAGATAHDVVPIVPSDEVLPAATEDSVGTRSAPQSIPTTLTCDPVVAIAAKDKVANKEAGIHLKSSRARTYEVGPPEALDLVGPAKADDYVPS